MGGIAQELKLEPRGDEEFEEIVDSPYGQEHARMMVGDGDDVATAEAEFTIEGDSGSAEDASFDQIVGALQDIVMEDSFQAALNGFCKENCHHFEDTEENKLVYTDLFQKYSDLIEGTLETKLKEAIPGFSMESFTEELAKRGQEEVDDAVFDLLVSLGDFDSFKQTMLDAKASTTSLEVAGQSAKIYKDEDDEGEERPDLEDLLKVAPVSPKA
mmetsp:Transcript_48120/g.103076  ORF Transcript_48120/g.103076 Transcript_48120/m.103076 type:complete len:214 (-) Transcript_48120:220-861(-)